MSIHALIIFAKLPSAGEVKTRLGEAIGMQEAARIYKQFAEHAFALGRELHETGTRVYVFYEPRANADEMRTWVGPLPGLIQQKGITLGERMRHAFEVTFAEGSERTVIIGTDVPELEVPTIEQAFSTLFSHDVVIGPSTDGGYYLLGMNTPTRELFDGIVWSSSTVFRDTLQRIQRLHLSFAQLDELADIDTSADYDAYLIRKREMNPRPNG